MADQVTEYVTLGGVGVGEIEEKKSVFIGHAMPIESEEEALAFIKEKKREFADARHNVYAYILGSGAVARASDDGEPQGTAGVVLLDALKKNGVTNAVIVVTRYFGGILLGAGGLVRAYSAAAMAAIRAAGIVTMTPFVLFSVTCSYAEHPRLTKELARIGAVEERTEFDEQVTVFASLPKGEYGKVETLLCEFAQGKRTAVMQGEVLRVKR